MVPIKICTSYSLTWRMGCFCWCSNTCASLFLLAVREQGLNPSKFVFFFHSRGVKGFAAAAAAVEMSVWCGGFLATLAEKCWGVFPSLRINRCFWQITERSVIWIIQDWLKDVVSPFSRRLGFLLEGKYLNKTSCKATEVPPVRLVILGTELSHSLECSLAKQNCAAASVT